MNSDLLRSFNAKAREMGYGVSRVAQITREVDEMLNGGDSHGGDYRHHRSTPNSHQSEGRSHQSGHKQTRQSLKQQPQTQASSPMPEQQMMMPDLPMTEQLL